MCASWRPQRNILRQDIVSLLTHTLLALKIIFAKRIWLTPSSNKVFMVSSMPSLGRTTCLTHRGRPHRPYFYSAMFFRVSPPQTILLLGTVSQTILLLCTVLHDIAPTDHTFYSALCSEYYPLKPANTI